MRLHDFFPDRKRFEWFKAHSANTIKQCQRTADSVPGLTENPVSVYVPGGDDKYPSFWVRDAVMQCRSGLVNCDEMKMMLQIILFYQNGHETKILENKLRITPWAIPDHINLPGLADLARGLEYGGVFFPGSYNVGNEQGYGACGFRPADDDIYEVVDLTHLIYDHLDEPGRKEFLQSTIADLPVIERLHNGMQSMSIDPETGLCWNTEDDWAASSFHDELISLGLVALPSILRFRASLSMAHFFNTLGDNKLQNKYKETANQISNSIVSVLMEPSGWILAASKQNRQPDVWSTSMAVYFNLLDEESEKLACEALLNAYREGQVSQFGYLRHVPLFGDATPGEKVWDHGKRFNDYGHYQNGGYWPQPIGYYVFAISKIDINSAKELANEFIDHTQAAAERGAPFEWINKEFDIEECRWYGPSVSLPLESFNKLSKKT